MRPTISIAAVVLSVLFFSAKQCPAQAVHVANLLGHPDEWYTSDAGKQTITNVISWQTPAGGWAKGYKADQLHKEGEPLGEWEGVGTIDNKFTCNEIRFLARAYTLTKRQDALDAFNRGIDFLLNAQYPNGGWPQRFPVPSNYGRLITFNDNAMTHVLQILEDIHDARPEYAFVDPERKQKAKAAFDRGIDCILKAQIKSAGKLTGWAQQYDPETLQPALGRSYELPSISGSESTGPMELLMTLEAPSGAMVNAVHAAAAWYEASKIMGIRYERRRNDAGRMEIAAVKDPSAGPLWARFYEIDTNRPFFCNRDGIKRYSLDEIDRERGAGYAWYGDWGNDALKKYAKWAAKHPPGETPATKASADSAPAAGGALVVAADGSGQFKTVQSALDAAPSHSGTRIVIQIKPGTYKERLVIPKDKPMITFQGEDANTTILTYDFFAKSMENGKEVGTSGSYSTLVQGADFSAKSITFANTAGEVGQAVALRCTGERQAFEKCRILGWQDTLYVHEGRQYFKDCYIEGRVDFIFGKSTAVFESCTIHSKNGGYVTAAATPQENPFGFVFLNCKLTGEGAPALLGRPWRPYGAVAFIKCDLGSHIRPEGWDNWRKVENEKTARFSEYQCTGPGAKTDARVGWSRQLSDDEATKYTLETIFAVPQPWNPATSTH